MQVESWSIDRPIPYARNARVIPQIAIDKVAASIKEFGFRVPIVVDNEGVIVAGHTRLRAAQKLGLKSVPVHVATDLSKAQIRAFRLADNRVATETSFDNDLLAVELADLKSEDFDLSILGFDDSELEKLFNGESDQGGSPGDPGEDRYKEQYAVIVTCKNVGEQERIYNDLMASGYVCKVVST